MTVAVTMIGMGGDVQRRGWRAEMGEEDRGQRRVVKSLVESAILGW